MKALIVFLVVIAQLSGISLSQEAESCDAKEYEEGVYKSAAYGAQIFTPELYKAVSSIEGNLVIAPFSVAVLLGLLRTGTTGYGLTGRQLSDALHLPLDNFLVAQGFRQILDKLPNSNDTSEDEARLLFANRMFVQRGYNIEECFEETAMNDFKSGVQKLNFKGDIENSRETINQWVEDSTRGKVTELIPEGSLSSDTRLLLANAIYFRGSWLNPFIEANTKDETFYISDSETVTVPMMHGTIRARYGRYQNSDATSLRLPYYGSDFEAQMIFLLPNSRTGLASMEKNLENVQIYYEIREVNVYIPRFKFDSSLKLNEDLIKMGVTEIFRPDADLRGIFEDEGLHVDQILQKVFIEVSENGTEAAAAAEVGMSPLSTSTPVDFKADHPFLFVIRDEDNMYFIGRVVNPKQ